MQLVPKSEFYNACLKYVQQRMEQARVGIASAQESSNTETKSSAGDKYETGRAMAQQERDRHAVQLHEAQQLLNALQRINPELPFAAVRPGALVQTNIGLFYISIGAGRLRTGAGQDFVAASPEAPIVVALNGRHAGEEITFNGRLVQVLEVS
ncbi:MAG: 3-oxoacyl-ACP synthase [Hymenobacter sp.]|nr:MAG: 3-oxoacyl-ACP synthase [Hymenobacter sp.]